jgi:hypothetical protein
MSCAAGTSGVFRRIGLLAGAVAFLLQMFVWSIQAPAVAAGSLIPVCTVDGITLVDLNPDAQNPDSGSGDPAKAKFKAAGCPLCPLAQGLSVPPPALEPAKPSFLVHHSSLRLPGDYIAAGWYLSSLKARAPLTRL